MDNKGTGDVNAAFGISDERIAELQAQAQQAVSREIDEAGLLAKFKAEALARAEVALKAQAEAEVAVTIGGEGKGAPDAHGFSKIRHKIFIHEAQSLTDPDKVPVSINGYAWEIQRGVNVLVPPEVIGVLNNAMGEATVRSEGGLITRPMHRFPFQDFGVASAKDIADFEEVKRSAGVRAQS